MKIGFYDSGVGGLMVLREVFRIKGCFDVVYLGDLANFPYGNKSKEELLVIGRKGIKFLISKGADMIVVACNTLSTVVGNDLKAISNVPTFLITEWIGELNIYRDNLIVIGTEATIKSGYYQQILNARGISTPKLAEFVEGGIWEGEIVENYINSLLPRDEYTLLLACTHYTALKETIKRIRPNVEIIDISQIFADFFSKKLKNSGGGKVEIFFTLNREGYDGIIKRLNFPCEVVINYINPL
ncbi:MAG: hypothetical protein ABIL16_04750 [candidate division WOR-3 bacterium]